MSAETVAQPVVAHTITPTTLDDVLDAAYWDVYTGRGECPIVTMPTPWRASAQAARYGVRVGPTCVCVAPMTSGDWQALLVELTAAAPAAMTDLSRRGLIFEQAVNGSLNPERYLLGLTIG